MKNVFYHCRFWYHAVTRCNNNKWQYCDKRYSIYFFIIAYIYIIYILFHIPCLVISYGPRKSTMKFVTWIPHISICIFSNIKIVCIRKKCYEAHPWCSYLIPTNISRCGNQNLTNTRSGMKFNWWSLNIIKQKNPRASFIDMDQLDSPHIYVIRCTIENGIKLRIHTQKLNRSYRWSLEWIKKFISHFI